MKTTRCSNVLRQGHRRDTSPEEIETQVREKVTRSVPKGTTIVLVAEVQPLSNLILTIVTRTHKQSVAYEQTIRLLRVTRRGFILYLR